jgi:hypothetical protein
MGKMDSAYKMLVGKRLLERPRRRWEYNVYGINSTNPE